MIFFVLKSVSQLELFTILIGIPNIEIDGQNRKISQFGIQFLLNVIVPLKALVQPTFSKTFYFVNFLKLMLLFIIDNLKSGL